MKDNVVDKNVKEMIEQQNFQNRTELHYVINDMIEFYAEHFTKSNTKSEAKKMLSNHTNEMRRSDAFVIIFSSGMSLILFLLGVFFMVTPTSDPYSGD